VGNSTTAGANAAAALLSRTKLWLKVLDVVLNLGLVLAGIIIASAYGKISELQSNLNLRTTSWRDCIDLPVMANEEIVRNAFLTEFAGLATNQNLPRTHGIWL
jgi:hypothetical protein